MWFYVFNVVCREIIVVEYRSVLLINLMSFDFIGLKFKGMRGRVYLNEEIFF